MDEKDDKKKHVHDELEGFNVKISPFGQIETNYDIDKINKFLDKRVEDKKLPPKGDKSDTSTEQE